MLPKCPPPRGASFLPGIAVVVYFSVYCWSYAPMLFSPDMHLVQAAWQHEDGVPSILYPNGYCFPRGLGALVDFSSRGEPLSPAFTFEKAWGVDSAPRQGFGWFCVCSHADAEVHPSHVADIMCVRYVGFCFKTARWTLFSVYVQVRFQLHWVNSRP